MPYEAIYRPQGIFNLERELVSLSGARAVRITECGRSLGREHAHDWPILSICILGEYSKVSDLGALGISSPSVVFHPAGSYHANDVGDRGLEQIDIEFDPAWLPMGGVGQFETITCWIGGPVSVAARRLVCAWTRPEALDAALARATGEFLSFARATPQTRPPAWLETARRRLRAEAAPCTRSLAKEAGLSPAWFRQAYRAAAGEGVGETVARLRTERAAWSLRNSTWAAAQIACEAGFCDQSHMIHTFRKLLGRTPAEVRAESSLSAMSNPYRAVA